MAARLFRYGLGLVFVVAGLALAAGFDRLGHRAEVLGVPLGLRVALGLWQVVAGGLILWPGRVGVGAAMGLAAAGLALVAHLGALGLDSAPPALALVLACGVLAWRHRGDLGRQDLTPGPPKRKSRRNFPEA